MSTAPHAVVDRSAAAPVPCRFCRSVDGAIVVDLGEQPSSELFPAQADPGPDPVFPLRMWLCASCGLAQLADDADVPEEPTGQEPAALSAQRADAMARLAHVLPTRGTAAEFPSPHGGTWLDLLAGHGLDRARPGQRADVVVDGCFGVMHAADQRAALRARADRLADGGTLVLQFHSLAAVVAERQWNALRLGHYAYYSTPAMVTMLAELGLTATGAWVFPLYGGTVALTASRGGRRGPQAGGARMARSQPGRPLVPVSAGVLPHRAQTHLDGRHLRRRAVAERPAP